MFGDFTWEVDVGLQRGQAGVAQSPQLIDPELASTARQQLPQRDPLEGKHEETQTQGNAR